ncbi:hypothetical protein GUITHDRAFT_143246 [Guillardia theta CCMP2712]|uniref:PPM-type phosphatase domain-containing protein n=1 Tax=Guillardia theta (strain CCMP2712) TaxID=905079 RepID=L1IUW1_GUITC|nr:hypothetical protein GUITHDRAFT_143246 [Guillardia theta CCMP2712]EKX39872.1 hypothetical protein GUITHDRAFT_143246 [Guillardia theta CCMP2712]|eukprot:XP_005826852.1 hypothetical protein GUITHDRAFT_143246 [Guillardia theta CCMP2712]
MTMQLFGGNAPLGDAISNFLLLMGYADFLHEILLVGASSEIVRVKSSFLPRASSSRPLGGSRQRARGQPWQDSAIALVPLQQGINMYSVFDGHGPSGHIIAEFLSENFPRSMKEALTRSQGSQLPEWVKFAFSQPSVSFSFTNQIDYDASEAFGATALSQSGATATIVLQDADSLLVASVGDSRAILAALDGTSISLTTDHNPADPTERNRIEASGGMVSVFPGEPSVEESGKGRVFLQGQSYPGLATSRAFGDYLAKQAGVTAEPDLKCVKIGKNKVLILATDGVWDVLDEQTAVATCLQFYNNRDAATAAQGPLVGKEEEEEGKGDGRGSYSDKARRASEGHDSTGGCFTNDLGGATRIQG